MAEQGDIEHTLVMSDTSGTETGSKSGSLRSDIVIEGSHKTIETVDLNADSSLEFRRTLEKSGKRYQIRKMIAEGGFGRIFLAKDLVLGRDVIIKSLKEEHGPCREHRKIHFRGETQCPAGSPGHRSDLQLGHG